MTHTSTVNLYSYTYRELRTYALAMAFVAGNILLPQMLHTIPQGGMIWLPIYFFTLVGAFKYGWRVGLLTAIASPLVNSCFFGMPSPAVLPAILSKSVLLAAGAGYAAKRYGKPSLLVMLGVVLFYQAAGSLVEWLLTGSLSAALQDVRLGIPGMVMQVVGGNIVIKYLLRN